MSVGRYMMLASASCVLCAYEDTHHTAISVVRISPLKPFRVFNTTRNGLPAFSGTDEVPFS
jgi:hypothetical protein